MQIVTYNQWEHSRKRIAPIRWLGSTSSIARLNRIARYQLKSKALALGHQTGAKKRCFSPKSSTLVKNGFKQLSDDESFKMNPTLDFFFIQRDVFKAEALFKQSVQTVEISISSYCNRRCSYCPNSLTDRISAKYFMADSLFFNVMRQLCKIEFDGEVHINRYNELLADRAYALKRIAGVKAFLLKCRLVVFTNGDYLDDSCVRALGEAGVDKILATVHEAAGGTSYSDLLTDQERRLKK